MCLCLNLFLLFSCSRKQDKVLDQVVIGQESEIERLNPITIKDPQTFRIAWQTYEGLLGLDEEGGIVPKLAESWETSDNKVWTFRIRKGVSFHPSEIFGSPENKRTITASDVLYSYTRFCSSESYPAFVLTDSIKGCSEFNQKKEDSVAGLKVIDDHTFQVELNKPEPFFINRITSPWIAIFPKEAEQEKFKDRWGLDLVVGTGPYRLISRTDNEIILVKNDAYWDNKRVPKIGKLIFRIIKNEQIRFTELTNNKIDIMVLPNQMFPVVFDSDGALKEKYKNDFQLKTISTFNTHLIGMNLKKVSDVHLRRAMFYGTNREEMVQKILYGYGDVIGGAVPPGMGGFEPLFDGLYDLGKAKEELGKSKYDGKEIELLIHDLANSEQIGQIFQKQMADMGIKINLTKIDFNSAIGRMVKGDTNLFSMFAEVVFSSPEPLLLNLFTTSKIPAPNFWSYSNPEIDQELEKLRDLNDRTASVRSAAEIEKKIMDDVPAIFLYRQKNVVIHSKNFQNLKVNGHNHFMFETLEKSR